MPPPAKALGDAPRDNLLLVRTDAPRRVADLQELEHFLRAAHCVQRAARLDSWPASLRESRRHHSYTRQLEHAAVQHLISANRAEHGSKSYSDTAYMAP